MGDGNGRVPIAEFVTSLREELKAAQAWRDPELQFAVGPVQVEFTVMTEREGGPEGKVRFWVIEAGASAKRSRSATQKVTLALTPVSGSGRPVHVSDQESELPP